MLYYKGNKISRMFDVANYILFFLISLLMLYPFIYTISLSISNLSAVALGKVILFPVGFQTVAYSMLLKTNDIINAYMNTITYTVLGTVWALFVQTMAAYALVRKPKGYKVIVVMMTITMFFNGGLVPSFLVMKAIGFIDKIWAIVIPGAFLTSWTIFMMRVYYKITIPDSLYESAHIDGANEFKIYLSIILPLSTPMLATMGLFAVIRQWNSFLDPLIYLNDARKWPLQLVLRRIVQLGASDPGKTIIYGDYLEAKGYATSLKAAAIILTTGPILLVYPFVQKYFVQGMTLGSIKG
ncbi:MAG: carbohydrate ABC transporter permease [Ruminiclostridium sp.]|nr:carbohydrate ABC transporter permease [Ruminiclostridium sp.]